MQRLLWCVLVILTGRLVAICMCTAIYRHAQYSFYCSILYMYLWPHPFLSRIGTTLLHYSNITVIQPKTQTCNHTSASSRSPSNERTCSSMCCMCMCMYMYMYMYTEKHYKLDMHTSHVLLSSGRILCMHACWRRIRLFIFTNLAS